MQKGAGLIGDKIVDILIERIGKSFKLAFLPYNHSMFDCMESVYLSARAKGVESYLVPVPYFVFDKNRKIRKVILDTQYKYPTLPYSCLLMDAFKDVEYCVIHNPYDANNTVTQIVPNFQSSALKAKGKKIIYIPYYYKPVGAHTERFFINHSGVKNADFVFLNDEVEREDFIQNLKIETQQIFATGSPKLDAVQKYKDRSTENVVLVINSLIPFITNPLTRLKRYKEVIKECVEQGKTVIFRPHPLLTDAIYSMCSDLAYREYAGFLNWANEVADNCYFAYQDYDLEYLMSISGFLYADPSSVVGLWQTTGKPYEIM